MLSVRQTLLSMLAICIATFFMTACEETGSGPELESQLEVYTATDIPANPEGQMGGPNDFTFYSLADNEIVADADSASDQWDIAFSSTNIIVNNSISGPGNAGAVVLDADFENVTTAPTDGYQTDSEGQPAISGWYNYTGQTEPTNAIIPLDNKTIAVRTGDGEYYAKIKILSYYEGNPDTSTDSFADLQTRPPSRYYTFEYAIQLDGSTELN